MSWRIAWVLGVVVASRAGAGQVEVKTLWHEAGEAQFTILAGDRELCRFSGRRREGDDATATGTCRFELPADAKALTVRGRFVEVEWNEQTGKGSATTISGEQTIRLRDAAPITRPLRDRTLSPGERWRRAAAAERALVAAIDGIALIDLGQPAGKKVLDETEKRLGFALPAQYRALVSEVGALSLSDHGVPAPATLSNAFDTIFTVWGHGDGGIPAWVPKAAIDRLKRSVLLFEEVGDGMGAVLFLAPPNKPCGERFASTYLHEEGLVEAMQEIAADRLSCDDFDAVLLDQVESLLLLEHESTFKDETGELLVDSSSPHLELTMRTAKAAGGGFGVDLSRE